MPRSTSSSWERACSRLLRLAALAIAIPAIVVAATTTVTSLADLQAAINTAAPGDTIIVANGTYTATSTLSINRQGTAAAPITIAAESIGGVEIRGSRGFSFSSPAAYVTLRGFVLKHASAIGIPSGTRFIRLTRNVIELAIPAGTDVSYLNISGDDVEIDRNELRNKSTLGEMLDIAGSGSQVARRLWVHHNYFHDFTSPGGNGAETIRWGLSGLSLSTGNGLCEYNLFERCVGENEMISNKSSGNVYRYNTVLDSPGGEISQRHGDNCQYYGNIMRNTAGIRIYGDSHLVHSNYLEGNSIGITIGNGDGDVRAGDALTVHDRPHNCTIVFNTLVDNATHYTMNGRTGGLGATNTTFANNLIVGGGTVVSISTTGPFPNPTWRANLIWNSTNLGNIPDDGYTRSDPLLARDARGVLHLQSGSPAIDAGAGDYAAVLVDLDGQSRSGAKDIGADEFSATPVVAQMLTPADVGPHSLEDKTPPAIAASPAAQTIVAGDSAVFSITATGASLAYQWHRNGTAITGAIAASHVLRGATAADAGIYHCVVTNPGGTATSATAALTVVASTNPGRIVNLAIRSTAGTGAQTLIVGAAIGGAGASGTQPLLLRAVGPSLGAFGVPGTLADPALALISGPTTIAANDNWAGDATVAATALRVGAFALASAASNDAALLPGGLAPGAYSMQVSSAGSGGEGIALAEIYDATRAEDLRAGAPRLINVSARTQVGTGGGILIAGFAIGGETSKTVLIRAVGPGLAVFGLTGLLADPKLELFSSAGTQLEANDNWAGTTSLVSAADSVGAFRLDAISRDAALLVTLAPGSYTAQVSGIASGTGVALVEVYAINP